MRLAPKWSLWNGTLVNYRIIAAEDPEMTNRSSLTVAMVVPLLLIGGCGPHESDPTVGAMDALAAENTMKLTSSEFADGATMKARYTIEGEDISPPLSWSDAPSGTSSFTLICDDPDAPNPKHPAAKPWVHWVIYNIPADATELPAGISRHEKPSAVAGAVQGANSWSSDNIGYRGPAPPEGSGPHRYFFKLFALDTTLDLPAGATKEQLSKAMAGHVLAAGQLVGICER